MAWGLQSQLRSETADHRRHCEELRDEAIQWLHVLAGLLGFARNDEVRLLRLNFQIDPHWNVVGRLLPRADVTIDSGSAEPVRRSG